jgi:hypothetical protein
MTPAMKHPALLLLALVPCVALAAWLGQRALTAHDRLDAAQRHHEKVIKSVALIDQLRNTTPSAAPKPPPNVSGQVADVLVEAGLAPALLTNLAPGAETSVGPCYRRQAARLTLEPITLPDLGRLLNVWRSTRPEWTIASITVSPQIVRQTGANQPDAADTSTRTVRVNLLIECLYTNQSTAVPNASLNPSSSLKVATP